MKTIRTTFKRCLVVIVALVALGAMVGMMPGCNIAETAELQAEREALLTYVREVKAKLATAPPPQVRKTLEEELAIAKQVIAKLEVKIADNDSEDIVVIKEAQAVASLLPPGIRDLAIFLLGVVPMGMRARANRKAARDLARSTQPLVTEATEAQLKGLKSIQTPMVKNIVKESQGRKTGTFI